MLKGRNGLEDSEHRLLRRITSSDRDRNIKLENMT
jgi:hypothetical protein